MNIAKARPRGVAVITGASSGIGEAIAGLLARHGFRLALIARRGERLRQLARQIALSGGKAIAIRTDLASTSERWRAYKAVRRAYATVDIVVNNAGLGWYGHAADMSWRTARQLLRVNIEAVVHLTLLFLGDMLQRGRGHIIMVGSLAGGLPSQGVAVYGATKSFLDNFATALHRELADTGVNVSVIRPGPVRTEFGAAALRHPNGLRVPTERIGVDPERVAAGILSLIRRPRRVVYVPSWLRIVPWVELTLGWVIDRLGPLLLRSAGGARRRPGEGGPVNCRRYR